MNITQNGNAIKFIAFFLVGVILLCLFGFTVDGWQTNNDKADTPPPSNETESSESNQEIPDEPQIYIPQYVNPLTGLETEAEFSLKRHLAFIMDPCSPLYGTSFCDIIVEFPIEAGESIIAAITNNYAEIGKIGSLTKTRDYISRVIQALGSVIISNGTEKSITYNDAFTLADVFDLESFTECKYTEFNTYTYSNGALISQGLNKGTVANTYDYPPSLPFTFPDFGQDRVRGDSIFNCVTIPFSNKNVITLQYDEESKSYSYIKNSTPKSDLLNGNDVKFENCLVLFADSVTYEDSNGLQMVLKTNDYGTGYFFTEGTAKEITWEYSNIGSLTFYDEAGAKLAINRGRTYIAFVKSSEKNNITLS